MRTMSLRSPLLGLIGLIAVGLVAMKLFTGDLDITQAAVRVGVVAAVLLLTERLLLPIAKGLVMSGRRPEE